MEAKSRHVRASSAFQLFNTHYVASPTIQLAQLMILILSWSLFYYLWDFLNWSIPFVIKKLFLNSWVPLTMATTISNFFFYLFFIREFLRNIKYWKLFILQGEVKGLRGQFSFRMAPRGETAGRGGGAQCQRAANVRRHVLRIPRPRCLCFPR